jgi:polysaccharide biosynthesis transport protein
VLGLALVFLLELFDRRLKSLDELNRLLALPHLASLPTTAFKRSLFPGRRREGRAVSIARGYADTFERLRTGLLVFNADRKLKTLIVASAQDEREGKTTVAANLALALAKTGLKVCVVDADLRRPRLARSLGVSDSHAGLTDVLTGMPLEDAVQNKTFEGVPGITHGNGNAPHTAEVSVLAAGRKHPHPGGLIASTAMFDLLDRLESEYDIVVLDCPPLRDATDALPLFARASGTLLVVRLFHTSRDNALRAVHVIDRSRGGILGVVGTGVSPRDLREEGYGPWPAIKAQASNSLL